MAHIGKYRLLHLLGSGAMGSVFAAMREDIGRQAAIKLLHPWLSGNEELATRFRKEARAANLAAHPGIVQTYDLGVLPGGGLYIVMEMLSGTPLAKRLDERRMSQGWVFLVLRQIALAMAAAHARGVVHRDLKPSNIMLVPDSERPWLEQAKIIDFGVAHLSGCEAHERTRPGLVLGTPVYMAPEQWRGMPPTGKADVYALGVIAYQALYGTLPVPASSPASLLQQLALPTGQRALLRSMLHQNPAQRPTMHEVAQRLTCILRARCYWFVALALVSLLLLGLLGLCLTNCGSGTWAEQQEARLPVQQWQDEQQSPSPGLGYDGEIPRRDSPGTGEVKRGHPGRSLPPCPERVTKHPGRPRPCSRDNPLCLPTVTNPK